MDHFEVARERPGFQGTWQPGWGTAGMAQVIGQREEVSSVMTF